MQLRQLMGRRGRFILLITQYFTGKFIQPELKQTDTATLVIGYKYIVPIPYTCIFLLNDILPGKQRATGFLWKSEFVFRPRPTRQPAR